MTENYLYEDNFYGRYGLITNYHSNAEKKKTYFPHILNTFKVKPLDLPNNKNEYGNVYKYLKNTNLNHFLKKDLRQEIMDDTKNLIDRISKEPRIFCVLNNRTANNLMKIIKNRVIFSKNCLGIDMVITASQDQ